MQHFFSTFFIFIDFAENRVYSGGMKEKSLNPTIASRIKEIRITAGMKQGEFGALFGVSPSGVSRWELGETSNMKREVLVKMSERFHVNPLWIMGFDVPKMARTQKESELEQQITDKLVWLNESQLRKLLKFMEEFL